MFKDKALELAEQHYAVFPLKSNGKTPLTPNGFKDATTDPVQIEAWAKKFPDANIGIACGSASHHLVVVDIDNKNGVNGSESIRKWQEEHGDFPSTKTIMTPTGGYHLYFRDMTEYGSPVGILDGVDIRANGSYVVAEGSKIFGKEYKPLDTSLPAMTNRSVIDLLNHCRVDRSGSSGGNRFEYATEKVSTGRNNYLISYAGYYCKVNPNASLDDAKSSIIEENNERCDPPLSISEIENTVFKSLPKILEREKKKHEDEGYVLPGCFDEEFLKEISKAHQPQADDDGLPPIVNFGEMYGHIPALKPVLIDGVLRQGHKMIISSGSKAGKSYLLINLAIMIAEGWQWLGHKCTQGKVLYINMEIDHSSFANRVDSIYRALGLDTMANRQNIDIWTLRGYPMPLNQLIVRLQSRVRSGQYSAIIIDPLYKVMEGDENSNSDIAQMVTGFDRIANETGASVIYAHHYSKGYAGDKQVIDRSSGAGVFARDPDAILSMSEIDIPEDERKAHTAFRVEYVLREFKSPDPTDIWFDFPLHKLDTSRQLQKYDLLTGESAKKKRRNDAKAEKESSDVQMAYDAVDKNEEGKFKLSDFMNEMGIKNRNTARDILTRNGFTYEDNGNGRSAMWYKR